MTRRYNKSRNKKSQKRKNKSSKIKSNKIKSNKSKKNRHKGGFLKWQKKCMPGSKLFGCPSGKTCKWGSGFMDISYGVGLDNHHCL